MVTTPFVLKDLNNISSKAFQQVTLSAPFCRKIFWSWALTGNNEDLTDTL